MSDNVFDNMTDREILVQIATEVREGKVVLLDHERRLRSVEKRWWMVIGGGIVFGWLGSLFAPLAK